MEDDSGMGERNRVMLRVSISPRRLLMTLFGAAVVLLGVHYVGLAFDPDGGSWNTNLRRLSNLDDELSVATWYSSALLLAAGGVSWIAGSTATDPVRRGWRLLGAALTFLSIDEAARIHEMADGIHQALDIDTATTFLWVVPYGLAGLVLLWTLRPMLVALPRRTAVTILAAGALYVGAALGLELVAALFRELSWDAAVDHGTIPVEETLEMAGVSLFIAAVIGHTGATTAQPLTSGEDEIGRAADVRAE